MFSFNEDFEPLSGDLMDEMDEDRREDEGLLDEDEFEEGDDEEHRDGT